ncbi:hypothetical protein LZ480_18820 [Solibacillus sp. MA9]|uniref:VCBS repeat-containing protein n=1 Tax=Solibacillus palustris TaxID=2908203 RepID=A0ABS9UHW3_9BACL|nr:hypothetical protein [Solibacillus sp. MA9]MCH7323927.1 hypothetical protein [Solibacillus sp. MA9]
MKKYIIFSFIFLLASSLYIAVAATPEQIIVAQLDKENITIYAKKKDGLFQDFKIDFKGKIYSRPFWINVTNPAYVPQVYYEDINKDGKNELIVILTKGYGTGVLDQEVNVFHIDTNHFEEVLVDHPMAIINKNVKANLTPSKAEIMIGKKRYVMNVKALKLLPETMFNEINFGSIINYEVENNQLIATLHPRLSPGAFVGSIIITYEYRNKMYQAKSIEFQLE